MGSTKSTTSKTKFNVPIRQPHQPSSSQAVDVEESNTVNTIGGGLRLKFVEKKFYEDVLTKEDEMKRSASPSDKAFIDDLLNSRFIEPELSAAIIQEHVQRVVEARKSFYDQLQAAQESMKVRLAQLDTLEVTQEEIFSEESEVQQWLTESTTSENIAQTSSDVKESPHVKPETVHSS